MPSEKTSSSSTFGELNTALQGLALKATRHAAGLPSDLAFHRTLDRGFGQDVDACSDRILGLTNRLLALVETGDASTSASRRKGKERQLEGQDDVVDAFQSIIVDAMDRLLERTDACLDEALGLARPAAIPVNPKNASGSRVPPPAKLEQVVQHAAHLVKPQLKFDHSTRSGLKHKYNAQVPLGHVYRDELEMQADGETISELYHPYRYELTHAKYPERMFVRSSPIEPRSFDDTPFTWVATKNDFEVMLEKLRHASELAIDLEHHSYRTFSGFVCLMQVSTREEDFIADTLLLREELEALNEVFTNPKIVKVLHGAESDIIWLQQDFNLYIVNLFDTFHASKILGFPKHGLGTLLEMYCDFTADKRYQLADWRVRPLTPQMRMYARSDTHFLLFIYDHLRNALLDRADDGHELVDEVLARSQNTALRVYEPELYDYEGGSGSFGWDTLMRKWNKVLVGMQLGVYKAVHAWRDEVARQEDESIRYVLPNQYLFKLAQQPPADMATLLSVFQPIPPVVRKRSAELLKLIREVVKEYLTGATSRAEASSTIDTIPVEKTDEVESLIATANPTSVAPAESPASLWRHTSPAITATTSSLLTSSILSNRSSVVAPSSTLFGEARTAKRRRAGFEDVVSRIHGTLLVAPKLPDVLVKQAALAQEVADAAQAAQEPTAAVHSGGAEIVFVAASQRHTIPITVDDAIVVVGRRQKRKKRERVPQGEDSELAEEGSTEPRKDKKRKAGPPVEDEGAPFDYGAARNILDDMPEGQEDRKRRPKKQRRDKGGVIQYGDFPAPPKAHSEVKKGNQSHTFR